MAELTKVQALRLKADPRNIQVIAIGVAGANMEELLNIATSPEQVFFLDSFAAFADVKDQISNTICNAPIVGGNGNNLVALVAQGTEIDGVDQIFPGYVNFKLEMAGRTTIRIFSSEEVTFYMSYSNTQPSPAAYDYTFDVTSALRDVPILFK